MDPNILRIVVIAIVAILLWYANETLNNVPQLKKLASVAIVVLSVLFCLAPIINLLNSAIK